MTTAPSSILYRALCEALEDGYRIRASHAAVIDRFGPVRPFISVIQVEQRHISAVQLLLRRRGWPIPDDPYGGRVEAPNGLDEACRQGTQVQSERLALYQRLCAMTTEDDEVQAVFAVVRDRCGQPGLAPGRDCS